MQDSGRYGTGLCACLRNRRVIWRAIAEASRSRALAGGPQQRLPFESTTRFVRGRVLDVLRGLAAKESISLLDLDARLAPLLASHAPGAVANAVATLRRDGLVAGVEELRLSD